MPNVVGVNYLPYFSSDLHGLTFMVLHHLFMVKMMKPIYFYYSEDIWVIIDLDLKILKGELEFRIADGGKIHLNYLVGSKCWQPTSHFRILLWCRVLFLAWE